MAGSTKNWNSILSKWPVQLRIGPTLHYAALRYTTLHEQHKPHYTTHTTLRNGIPILSTQPVQLRIGIPILSKLPVQLRIGIQFLVNGPFNLELEFQFLVNGRPN